jgi:hypothetical protein
LNSCKSPGSSANDFTQSEYHQELPSPPQNFRHRAGYSAHIQINRLIGRLNSKGDGEIIRGKMPEFAYFA